jgi:hypothetical protein
MEKGNLAGKNLLFKGVYLVCEGVFAPKKYIKIFDILTFPILEAFKVL